MSEGRANFEDVVAAGGSGSRACPVSLLHHPLGVPEACLRPTHEREKSSLTRSVLSHTSMSSMTEGCATGIYGGGSSRPGSPTARQGETEHRTKEIVKSNPQNGNKMCTEQKNTTAQQARATRGSHMEWRVRESNGEAESRKQG